MVAELGSVGKKDVMRENGVVNTPVVLLLYWKKLCGVQSLQEMYLGGRPI